MALTFSLWRMVSTSISDRSVPIFSAIAGARGEEKASRSDQLITTVKVPDERVDFLTKVFEGPYQNVGKWAMEMAEYVKGKGKEIKKLYFSYTTCPKCAKAYGKNYVVLFAQIN